MVRSLATETRLDDGTVPLPDGRLYDKARIAAYDDVEIIFYAQTWDTPVFAMRVEGLLPSP